MSKLKTLCREPQYSFRNTLTSTLTDTLRRQKMVARNLPALRVTIANCESMLSSFTKGRDDDDVEAKACGGGQRDIGMRVPQKVQFAGSLIIWAAIFVFGVIAFVSPKTARTIVDPVVRWVLDQVWR